MSAGRIFDLQHYAVHDGPGIRTLVFLKGCPLRCPWCCNPESQRAALELRHRQVRCRGCLRCQRACARGAVSAETGRPRFDRDRCAACLAAASASAGQPACVAACTEDALELVGRAADAAEVVDRVARDLPFYRNSGGGVTFSGGEPLSQPDFLLEALTLCRDRGIHTAVETCGHADPAVVAAIEPLVDLFLFDVKLADDERFRQVVGATPGPVRTNLGWLAERAPSKLLPRVPLVPGFTDDPANLEAIGRLLVALGLGRVELMPYHAMGQPKYAQLGLQEPPELRQLASADLAAAGSIFGAAGLGCEIG